MCHTFPRAWAEGHACIHIRMLCLRFQNDTELDEAVLAYLQDCLMVALETPEYKKQYRYPRQPDGDMWA